MKQPLLARKIKVETAIRCDYDQRPIPAGSYATQVIGDPEEVKAQGIYHGRPCYDAALRVYEEKKKELENGSD